MKVLTLNCGSSTAKYKLIDTTSGENIAIGKADRIGMLGATVEIEVPGRAKVVREAELLDHILAINAILGILVEPGVGVLSRLEEIDAIGHRVVHGGETFTGSVLITPEVIQTLKDNIGLAPLHNPPNIQGIEAARALLPNVPMVGVFDTAYHTTMPDFAYIYPIPYALYKKYAIRRYGFHGTSHRYVSRRACELSGADYATSRIISLHLGNGASATAISGGISVDTSMGFTPLEGLVMGTRSGDIDPAIILYIMEQEKLSLREANNLLNKFSGMVGITGESSDMRDIETAMNNGDPQAILAMKIYSYRIKKYIGSYFAALGGVDHIAFTAGIGENDHNVRAMSLEGLECLGIHLDKEKNRETIRGREGLVSTPDSPVKVWVIPTNEELVIALDTAEIIERG